MQDTGDEAEYPEVKICGITNIEDARACVASGIDCVGFVFYPKSPRNLAPEQAGEIAAKFPAMRYAGVFVDSDPCEVARIAKIARLDLLQLHGKENRQYMERLRQLTDLPMIKCLYLNKYPDISLISDYEELCRGFLVEAEQSALPGGNGQSWDYSLLQRFSGRGDIIVAGGINPENFTTAIESSGCSAFDMSSGVEKNKREKDHEKIAAIGRWKQRQKILHPVYNNERKRRIFDRIKQKCINR